MEDAIAVPASPAHDAAIPPKNLLRFLEIEVERPVSLKEFNVSVFPFIQGFRGVPIFRVKRERLT